MLLGSGRAGAGPAPRLHPVTPRRTMKRSKNYRAAAELVTPGKVYPCLLYTSDAADE